VLSRLLAFQLPDNEIALVVPIPLPEVSEQQDEIIEFPAMDPLIVQSMKQRARGAVKYRERRACICCLKQTEDEQFHVIIPEIRERTLRSDPEATGFQASD
jgi:hypothetical protein